MGTGEFTTPEGNKLRYYCTGAGDRTFVLHQTQERDFALYYFAHQYAGALPNHALTHLHT